MSRAQRLEHPDLAGFLHDEGDLRAQDTERGNQNDEEQQVKHDIFLDHQRVENGRVFLRPERHHVFRAERSGQFAPHLRRLIGIMQHHHQPVYGVFQAVQRLGIFERGDDNVCVELIVSHVEDAPDGIIVGQHGFLLLLAALLFHLG